MRKPHRRSFYGARKESSATWNMQKGINDNTHISVFVYYMYCGTGCLTRVDPEVFSTAVYLFKTLK